jgi:hypothetical protein
VEVVHLHATREGIRNTVCSLCKKAIASGDGVRHPHDRHYVVHKACGIQNHGKELIDEWVYHWQVKHIKKDSRWLRDKALFSRIWDRVDPTKCKDKVCCWCGSGIEMETPWEHKEILGHPALIQDKGKSAFFFYADSTARWVEVPRKVLARWRWRSRLDTFQYDIWPWVKLVTLGAVLFALWCFVCIHLEPVIDIDQTLWWKIHELHASIFSNYDLEWGDFFSFWTVRMLVFAFNAGWFIFWTWMFLGNEQLKAFMRNLERQCSRR